MTARARVLSPDFSDSPVRSELRLAESTLDALSAPVEPEQPWVRPDVWAVALDLAEGDIRRIARIEYDNVLVLNNPGVVPMWAYR